MRVAVFLLLLLFAAGPAQAAWLEASSEHFVVYADDSKKDIRRFSDQLEHYHAAMAMLTGKGYAKPSPSNRVTVYVVSSRRKVHDLYGEGGKDVGGFYVPRAGDSLAIVPRIRVSSGKTTYSMTVLLHEYAHHFLASTSGSEIPLWLSEGAAEFFASASFEKDGTVGLGRPARHRANGLYGKDVKVEELLDPKLYEKNRGKNYDAYYGKSWLLFHYLTFSKKRQGQLERYQRLMMQGKQSREAAREAFGNFHKLEKELDRYMERLRRPMLEIPAERLETRPISVRKLGDGEAAMMPLRIRSKRGVDEQRAAELVVDARAVAARYPKDPVVLSALAEAEFDSGNDAEAIVAADAALAIDPTQVNAYVQKGLALFRVAKNAKKDDMPEAYKRARQPFLALNQMENEHPLPLIYYYRSFVEQGLEPPEQAVQGLERAVELAPFDFGVRMTLATRQIAMKQMAAAKRTLAPVAYNPHGGRLAEYAQTILARIDSDPAWDGKSGLQAMAPVDDGEGTE